MNQEPQHVGLSEFTGVESTLQPYAEAVLSNDRGSDAKLCFIEVIYEARALIASKKSNYFCVDVHGGATVPHLGVTSRSEWRPWF